MDALRDVWIGSWTTCGQQKHADHKVDHKPIHTQPPLAHTMPRGKISELRMPAAQQQNGQCLMKWAVISYSERMIYTARSHKPRSHYEGDGPPRSDSFLYWNILTVVMNAWWLSVVSGAGSAPAVVPDGWPRVPRCWSTMFCPISPFASYRHGQRVVEQCRSNCRGC